jgi:steroid 5-alpha reductase family enzyme
LGRIIFPSFVLTMLVLFGVWLAQGEWTWLNWALLASAAVITTIVFVDFVAVFTFGYATCMIVLPVIILAVRGVTIAGALVGGLSILYGLRLFAFALGRRRAASYAGARMGETMASKSVPTPLKVVLFVLVTWLQTFEAMPTYVVATVGDMSTWVIVGAALMAVGLVLETVTDAQKQRAKAADNTTFVRAGLYARWRHPNYTGEIVFQIGLAAAAFGSVTGWWQLLAVVVAPAYICVLMWFQARTGDERQLARYGEDSAYVEYRARSGSLLPR